MKRSYISLLYFLAIASCAHAVEFEWPPKMLFDQFRAEKDHRDLIAQEEMAAAAVWMLWLTGLSILVGAGGVVGLIISIRQTNKALKHAQRQAVRADKANKAALQQAKESHETAMKNAYVDYRPWLKVGNAVGKQIVIDRNEETLRIWLTATVDITNIGRTPALNVIRAADVTFKADTKALEDAGNRRGTASMTILPGDTFKFEIAGRFEWNLKETKPGEMDWLMLDVAIFYQGDGRDHLTTWYGYCCDGKEIMLDRLQPGVMQFTVEDARTLLAQ